MGGGRGNWTYEDIPGACLGVSLAKLFIFSLTTEIPRSSEAFNSSTRARKRSGLTNGNGKGKCRG